MGKYWISNLELHRCFLTPTSMLQLVTRNKIVFQMIYFALFIITNFTLNVILIDYGHLHYISCFFTYGIIHSCTFVSYASAVFVWTYNKTLIYKQLTNKHWPISMVIKVIFETLWNIKLADISNLRRFVSRTAVIYHTLEVLVLNVAMITCRCCQWRNCNIMFWTVCIFSSSEL